jgi:hypothetical protein
MVWDERGGGRGKIAEIAVIAEIAGIGKTKPHHG